VTETYNGWSWDSEAQRWTVQRGSAAVTCRLPKEHPPDLAAHLFAVQLAWPHKSPPEAEPLDQDAALRFAATMLRTLAANAGLVSSPLYAAARRLDQHREEGS